MKNTFLTTALITALAVAMPVQAQLQEDIELRVGDSLPPDHIITRNLTKPWIDAVQEISDGKISIRHYPAEQAGKAKDLLSLTQTGVLDIGYVGPAYVSDKMPLSGVGELPGMFTTSCEVTNAYWSEAQEGGYFFENEFKPNNIRPLFIAALPPYQIVISNDKEITDLADFAGMKVRAAGGAQELSLQKNDIVPVKMAPPEIYESMSRGTIDGTLLPFISIDSYKLSELAKSATRDANFGTVVVTYSISDRKWDSLPAEAQKILAQAGDKATKEACKAFDSEEQEIMRQLEQAGVHFVEFSEADSQKIESTIQEVAQAWADRLDRRNRPGTETLEVFVKALQAQQ